MISSSKQEYAAANALTMMSLAADARGNARMVFLKAAWNGHLELMQTLQARHKIDPAVDDNCALRISAANGHEDVVRYLLRQDGVDPSARENEALRLATEHGHVSVAALLVEVEKGKRASKRERERVHRRVSWDPSLPEEVEKGDGVMEKQLKKLQPSITTGE